MHGVFQLSCHSRTCGWFRHRLPGPVNRMDPEILEIIHDHQIRFVPRGNGAFVFQVIVDSRVECGHFHGFHRRTSKGHGFAKTPVNGPFLEDVFDVLVVCTETATAQRHMGIEQTAKQRLEVPGAASFPDEQRESILKPFDGFLRRHGFMVVFDPRCLVSLQMMSRQSRGMTVNYQTGALEHGQLFHHFRTGRENIRDAHDFRQPRHSWVGKERLHVPGREGR